MMRNITTKSIRTSQLAGLMLVFVSFTSLSAAHAQSLSDALGFSQPQENQVAMQESAPVQEPILPDKSVDEILQEENGIDMSPKLDVQTTQPKPLEDLQEIQGYLEPDDSKMKMPIDIRLEAVKEAALSYGARGGLAARSYDINQEIATRSSYLDKVFNFRQLLIAAPSGFMIEPPIISESQNALLIEGNGQQAAVADAIYSINQNVKIVSAPRYWGQYLERTWGAVEEPPEILRPKDDEERVLWRKLVKQGWEEGFSQANEVFENDLNRLVADFDGMVRYRKLLAQGMVSPPFAQQVDRGITGEAGRQTMRVGDRAVVITDVPQLITESDRWQPASR